MAGNSHCQLKGIMSLILVIFLCPDISYKEYIKNINKHKLSSFKVKSPSILFYFHEITSRTYITVCTTIYSRIHTTLGDLFLRMRRVCCWGNKMSADEKPARGRTRILADSARKRNSKDVLANYNKTRIKIGHQNDSWLELNEEMRVQTHA